MRPFLRLERCELIDQHTLAFKRISVSIIYELHHQVSFFCLHVEKLTNGLQEQICACSGVTSPAPILCVAHRSSIGTIYKNKRTAKQIEELIKASLISLRHRYAC